MSRSHAYRPYFGYHGRKSQKEDKRLGNRSLRRKTRILCQDFTNEDLIFPIIDEVLNRYSMRRDGKLLYWPYEEQSWLFYKHRAPLYAKLPTYWFYYRFVLRK